MDEHLLDEADSRLKQHQCILCPHITLSSLDVVWAAPLLVHFLHIILDLFLDHIRLLIGYQADGELADDLAGYHRLGATATECTLNAFWNKR